MQRILFIMVVSVSLHALGMPAESQKPLGVELELRPHYFGMLPKDVRNYVVTFLDDYPSIESDVQFNKRLALARNTEKKNNSFESKRHKIYLESYNSQVCIEDKDYKSWWGTLWGMHVWKFGSYFRSGITVYAPRAIFNAIAPSCSYKQVVVLESGFFNDSYETRLNQQGFWIIDINSKNKTFFSLPCVLQYTHIVHKPELHDGLARYRQWALIGDAQATLDRYHYLLTNYISHVAITDDGALVALATRSVVYVVNVLDRSCEPCALPYEGGIQSIKFNIQATKLGVLFEDGHTELIALKHQEDPVKTLEDYCKKRGICKKIINH